MRKIIIFIFCLMFSFSMVSCNKNTQTNSNNMKEKTEAEKKEDMLEDVINSLSKNDIEGCVKLMSDKKISPNDKCKNGDILYNNLLKIALEKSRDTTNIPSKYFEVFDYMNNKVDKNLIKFDENLDEKQYNFLGCIGIEDRNSKATVNNSTTENKTNTQTETKEKKNFTMNGLELLSYGTSKDGRYIIGTIKNNNNFNCSYAEVKVKITDTNGNILDTPIGNITYLGAGETWSYSVPVIVEANTQYNYQIIEMRCNR